MCVRLSREGSSGVGGNMDLGESTTGYVSCILLGNGGVGEGGHDRRRATTACIGIFRELRPAPCLITKRLIAEGIVLGVGDFL